MNESDFNFDKEHIWHPYTSLINPLPCIGVTSAEGVHLTLSDGRQIIDGMSSWWSTIHGYNNPRLNQAAKDQIDNMSHVMFGGITHPSAIALCRKLVDMTAPSLDRVFISDSGSVAVEVAIKMAIQYWVAKGQSQKSRLLTIEHGYHGDTFAAMSVCDPVNGMHELFNQVLKKQLFAQAPQSRFDQPWQESDIDSLRQLFVEHHHEAAAIILEPIVQGAGGMRIYHPNYLKAVRTLCDEFDVLLICDEIATGFGRTGKLFAYEHANIEPDILCVGKALTGGYMSLAATMTSQVIGETICRTQAGVFMHGPTFMANPLACAVANESLAILQENKWQQQVAAIEEQLAHSFSRFKSLSVVADIRVLGAIGVIELHQAVDMATIQHAFVDNGVWVRPFGKLVYIMPPYVISPKQLEELTTAIYQVISQLST
ncbi:adenosylmethionine--8-amino-7-oxononanoate transaminase [Psychrobium sp. 1_MG-2023]|uniref:adenosylmethionine--8-amino-7-oxononanoate transaminase n=1 Tax=Psychrobium sp. 1_MG-2023 TaxID=3062624 RepID=UPI000C324673|nr:adenosylmethionine--8-amino-7-oxononanoate transaminase [Psychrobium sp. 1_MG-2023]MDP2562487.1 adenosylmethionine--8-amino-7-oxononanoate transaminase [Psychrobium sp. 1_MG-2023]PKF54322.1 adenosylmethionine--8-amino-7-oxononanoate transaminase [Alteromonadales bacterium alter-6D02]